jgi:hypothetical protein
MRYEIKYVFPPACADEAERRILQLPCMFREIHRKRRVNNIYLDTPELSDYRDAVNGAGFRSKTRIRWYGELGEAANPQLEVKLKRGLVGDKRVSPFDGFTLPSAAALSVGNRTPSLINTYVRRYFATPDGMCRVTIDKEQRFYPVSSAASMGWQFGVPDNRIVLEVKFEKEDLRRVAGSIQAIGRHIGKNSKYVNGVNAVVLLRSTC